MNRAVRILLPAAFLLTAIAPAQTPPPKRPMTFADLMAMKRVSDPQISPSGKWVLFSVTDVSLEQNTRINHLWVVPLDGSASAAAVSGAAAERKEHQLTTGKGETNGRFSPDGKHISYTADDADGTSQIFLADWNDSDASIGTATQLTHISTGADGAIWSPDSQHLLLTSDVYPECSVEQGVQKERSAQSSPQAALADRVNPGLTPDTAPGKLGEISPLVNANLQPATWSDEAACNKAKDDAAAKDPVKAQIWTSLLYRHWDHYTGEKRSHILLVSATDGNAIRDLTPASNVGTAETPTFFLGAPIQYAWSPDSKEIAYTTNLDQVPAASTNNDIFTLAIDNATDNQQSRTTTKAVKISTSRGSDDAPAYSPDGKYLAFRSQARPGFESDKFNLVIFNRTTGTIRNLTTKFPNWVDEFAWIPNSARVLFAAPNHGEEEFFIAGLDSSMQAIWSQAHDEEDRQQDAEYGSPIISRSGALLVATKMSASMPTELVAMQIAKSLPSNARLTYRDDNGSLILQYTGKIVSGDVEAQLTPETQLTGINGQLLDQLSLTPMESFVFVGANGTKVEGFILRPPNFDPSKKYPLKFLLHGGPQTAWGDSWSYRWNWQIMAASGYVVIGINRRGSTGYGQKFVDEVSGDWGGRPYQDLMLGLDYAEKHYPFIDKTRECALGASYGGYMADWVLTHTNRFKCIVSHDGMSDPEAAFGTTEELWFPEWEFRPLGGGDGLPATGPSATGIAGVPATKDSGPAGTVEQTKPSYPWDFYGKPDSQNPYRRWSPMLAIKNAKTPTLIIHSQRDYRLDVSQGFELFTALQLRGVPSKFLYFPDEGHWVLKPQNSELWNATVSDWVDRWTHTNQYAVPR